MTSTQELVRIHNDSAHEELVVLNKNLITKCKVQSKTNYNTQLLPHHVSDEHLVNNNCPD